MPSVASLTLKREYLTLYIIKLIKLLSASIKINHKQPDHFSAQNYKKDKTKRAFRIKKLNSI